MKEIWVPILGYEKLYEVSNKGRVRSLIGKTKILKPSEDRGGYLKVRLSKDKKAKSFSVHFLVAQAYVTNPDPKNKNTVNHEDGIKKNNYYYNLNWASGSEQMIHAMAEIIQHNIKIHSNTVYKIDPKTKKIVQEYKSILYASKEENIERKSLTNNLNSGIILNGHLWESSKPKKRKVIVTNSSGNVIATYKSVSQASKETGVSRIGIFTSNKKNVFSKGLKFKIQDED